MQRKGFSSSEKQLEWFFSDFLCPPWGFSDALLCCETALDVDVVDPFPMVGARLAPGGFCRARAAAGHIGDIGSLIRALLQPVALSGHAQSCRHVGAASTEPVGGISRRGFSESSCG